MLLEATDVEPRVVFVAFRGVVDLDRDQQPAENHGEATQEDPEVHSPKCGTHTADRERRLHYTGVDVDQESLADFRRTMKRTRGFRSCRGGTLNHA